MLLVEHDQVVVAFRVHELHGRLDIALAAVLEHLLLGRVVFEVDERDPALERDGLLDAVDAAEHRLVLHLDAAFHVHALVQQRALPPRGQLLHALHQRVALALREEARALHGIHQQQQLMEGEVAPFQRILHRRALVGAHVQASVSSSSIRMRYSSLSF